MEEDEKREMEVEILTAELSVCIRGRRMPEKMHIKYKKKSLKRTHYEQHNKRHKVTTLDTRALSISKS